MQLYCHSGVRSRQAQEILEKDKWTHVTNAGGWFSGQGGAIKKLCDCASELYVSRRPLPERELIASTAITTSVRTVTCPKCGMFSKSGRVSCCAPGGAWYKKCGGAGNSNVEHRWFEGVAACQRKLEIDDMESEPRSDQAMTDIAFFLSCVFVL